MGTLVHRWTSADDLTPADLTGALRHGGVVGATTQVTGFTSEPVGVGVGIASLLWRLDLAFDPPLAGPRTVILKLPHTSPEVRKAPQALRFYEREVGFFANVSASTPIATPRCYWSAFDPETHDFVLLLEDISALDQHDQLVGLPIGDVRVASLALAAHHAACWERADVLSATWTGLINEPPMPQAMHQLLADRVPIFGERLGAELPAGTVAIAERIRDEIDVFLERLARGPLTLLHGDFKADNLFFTPAPERDVVAIDWQICFLGRAAYDLGCLMAQSVDTGVRRAHEREVVRDYHDALLAGGATGYSLDDCWDDYRRTILLSIVYAVGVVTAEDVDPRVFELARSMATRSALAIADLDATELFER